MADTEQLGLEVFVEGWQKFESIMDKLDKSVDKLDTSMQGSSKGASAFAVSIGTLAANAVMKLGEALLAAGRAVGDFAVDSVKMAADFQDQMAILSIAASSTGLTFDELKSAALAVGGDTQLLGVSATGAADSMTGLYKAGLTTTEIFGDLNAYMAGTAELGGALRASIDLAAASELDMVQASDLAAVTLASFGGELETEEERAQFITEAMNNFVQAADASVASVSDLAGAMVNVGPTASAMGISLEDTNNALAILSTRGISGSEAGTALKSMLTNLQRQTPAVTDALDELNVSLYDAEGNFVGMPGLVEQLSTSFAGLTDEQKNQYAQTIAGTYGMNALNTLLAEGVEGWDDMAEATANAATIQDQAAAKGQTFNAQMEAMEGVMETVKIQIGDALLPILSELVDWFSGMVEEHGPAITEAFQSIADAVLPLVQWFLSLLTTGDPLNDFFTQLPEPIQNFITMVQENLPLVQAAFDDVFNFIMSLVGTVIEWWQENMPLISEEGNKMIDAWNAIKESFDEIWEIIKTVVSTALEVILSTLTLFMQIAQRDWDGAWNTIKEIGSNIWDAIKSIFSNFLEGVLNVMGTTTEQFVATWRSNWEMAKTIAIAVWENIKTFFSTSLAAISTAISTTLAQISANWSSIFANIAIIAQTVWTTITTAISTAIASIKTTITTAWENIKTATSTAFTAIKTVIQTAITTIKNFLSGQTGSFSSIGGNLISSMADGIRAKISSLVNAAKDAVTSAINAAKDALGVGSPSKVFIEIGANTMQGMMAGVKALAPQVQATINAAVSPGAAMATQSAAPNRTVVNNVTTEDNRQFNLSTNTLMQPGQLALEFAAFSMATR